MVWAVGDTTRAPTLISSESFGFSGFSVWKTSIGLDGFSGYLGFVFVCFIDRPFPGLLGSFSLFSGSAGSYVGLLRYRSSRPCPLHLRRVCFHDNDR